MNGAAAIEPPPAPPASTRPHIRVLIGDDDLELTVALAEHLRASGMEVVSTITSGGLDVLYAYHQFQPDVVLLDIMMPRFNGITISHAILSRHPEARIILMSGRLGSEHPFVRSAGAVCFLPKPLRLATVVETIEQAVGTAAT